MHHHAALLARRGVAAPSALFGRHPGAVASISSSTVIDATNAALWVAVFVYGGSIALSDKIGRGWLDTSIPLRIGPSNVPGAGRGLFAAGNIAAYTTLGAYPGVLRTPAQYEEKRLNCPQTSSYCWVLEEGQGGVLDPTDERGVLLEPLPRLALGGFTLGAVPTTLALINEPGLGFDVNVATEQRGSEMLFSTSRDVEAGEELFLDYGRLYDRSSYGRPS